MTDIYAAPLSAIVGLWPFFSKGFMWTVESSAPPSLPVAFKGDVRESDREAAPEHFATLTNPPPVVRPPGKGFVSCCTPQ